MGLLYRPWYSQIPKFAVSLFMLRIAESGPPPDPVQCDSSVCSIENWYRGWPDRVPCTAAAVVYPTMEEEIVSAVSGAVENNRKIKVVSRWLHTTPKLACPGGNEGLVISTRDYNQNMFIDEKAMTVTVDSGIELRQLLDVLANAGLTIAYTPYFEGLSLGGLLSTGAHGSSFFQKGSAVHEYVTSMTLVIPATRAEGYAKVIQLTEPMEELNAAKVSLGVLGVISTVTLRLEPLFKRSVTNDALTDTDLEAEALPFAFSNEFGEITWHPAQMKAVYKFDTRVPGNASGNGVLDFYGFRPIDIFVLEGLRKLENSYQLTNNVEGTCLQGIAQVEYALAIGTGLKTDGVSFTGYPVVGYHHLLTASGSCLRISNDDRTHVCAWSPGTAGKFLFETAINIAVSQLGGFIKDVKALRDLNPKSLCGVDLYDGFYMRFLKASTAYLGEQDDSVSFDIAYYRSTEPDTPRLNEDVLEEIEQMAAFKYGGRPHWGKNRPVAFQGVWKKYPKLEQFLEVKSEFDPSGLFSNDWSDAMLGINPGPLQANGDHCALDGLCICSEDRHCAPEFGYLCEPGKVYKEARVCRRQF